MFKASAVNSGTPIAATSKICRIPHRTIHEWVTLNGSPLKKPGQNAVLSSDAKKQLHQRFFRLQQVGFGLTLNYIRRFVLKYARNTTCRIRGKAEWWERAGLLSEKEPRLNSQESRISQLWPTDDI
jgi:hypothetical protein